MSTEWFYQSLDQTIGPLKASELLQAIRAGRIGYDTPIRKDDSKWVPAHEVGGLLQAAVRDITQFKCPFCATVIPKPPAECTGCDRRVDETYLIQSAFPSQQARKDTTRPPRGATKSESVDEVQGNWSLRSITQSFFGRPGDGRGKK